MVVVQSPMNAMMLTRDANRHHPIQTELVKMVDWRRYPNMSNQSPLQLEWIETTRMQPREYRPMMLWIRMWPLVAGDKPVFAKSGRQSQYQDSEEMLLMSMRGSNRVWVRTWKSTGCDIKQNQKKTTTSFV